MKDVIEIIKRNAIRIKEISMVTMIFCMLVLIPFFFSIYSSSVGIYWTLFSVFVLIFYIFTHVNFKKSFCKNEFQGEIIKYISLNREYDTKFGWHDGPYLYIVEYEYKGRKRKKSIIAMNNIDKKRVKIRICKWFSMIFYIY